MTQLTDACESGNLQEVKKLLSEGADITRTDAHGLTSLALACRNGHLPVVKYLVEERGCNVDETSSLDTTCLMCACQNGHLPVIKYLIEERGANFEVMNHFKGTCLTAACSNDQLSTVKYLIEEVGANPHVKDVADNSVLLKVCSAGRLSVAKYLIEERGFTEELQTQDDNSVMRLACLFGNREVAEYLIIDNAMDPPLSLRHMPNEVGKFLRQCTPDFLSMKRRHRYLNMKQLIHRFGLDSHLESMQHGSPFYHELPPSVVHLYAVVESKEFPLANLKVYLPSHESAPSFVYANREKLSESCAFMHGLLSSEMNDVREDPEENGMEMVALSKDLTQGCPLELLKQLVIFLSWSKSKEDHLRHWFRISAEEGEVSFQHIAEALKYCRMCDTLGLEMDLTPWKDMINRQISRFNDQWIKEVSNPSQQNDAPNCWITNIIPFDTDMSDLWKQELGENADLHFFLILHAARSTDESPNIVAAESRHWLFTQKVSERYSLSVACHEAKVISKIGESTGFDVRTGEIWCPS